MQLLMREAAAAAIADILDDEGKTPLPLRRQDKPTLDRMAAGGRDRSAKSFARREDR